MKKKIKKITAAILTAAMVMAGGVSAWADDSDEFIQGFLDALIGDAADDLKEDTGNTRTGNYLIDAGKSLAEQYVEENWGDDNEDSQQATETETESDEYALDQYVQEGWFMDQYSDADGVSHNRARRVVNGIITDENGNSYRAWVQVIVVKDVVGFMFSIDGESFITPSQTVSVDVGVLQSSGLQEQYSTDLSDQGFIYFSDSDADFMIQDFRMTTDYTQFSIAMDLGTALGGDSADYTFDFYVDHNDDTFRSCYDEYINVD